MQLPLGTAAIDPADAPRYHADGFTIVRQVFPAQRISELDLETRRLLYLSYNALSDGGEQRDRHYAEFRQWLQARYAEYGKTGTSFR